MRIRYDISLCIKKTFITQYCYYYKYSRDVQMKQIES